MTGHLPSLDTLWTTTGVILGFQVATFAWRMKRELDMELKGEVNWMPLASLVNIASMVVLVAGVFILPILGISGEALAFHAFAVAILLLLTHQLALIGHYELFRPPSEMKRRERLRRLGYVGGEEGGGGRDSREGRPHCPRQEKIALLFGLAIVAAYVCAAAT